MLLLQVVGIGLIFAWERALRRADQEASVASLSLDKRWREHFAKAITRPRVAGVKEAKLPPDEVVVGIEVDGKARAYRIGAFQHPSGHLVNDLIGGVPVSVGYCNLSDCLRVYTDPRGSAPLEIEVAGRYGSEMVVKFNGALYFHGSGRDRWTRVRVVPRSLSRDSLRLGRPGRNGLDDIPRPTSTKEIDGRPRG